MQGLENVYYSTTPSPSTKEEYDEELGHYATENKTTPSKLIRHSGNSGNPNGIYDLPFSNKRVRSNEDMYDQLEPYINSNSINQLARLTRQSCGGDTNAIYDLPPCHKRKKNDNARYSVNSNVVSFGEFANANVPNQMPLAKNQLDSMSKTKIIIWLIIIQIITVSAFITMFSLFMTMGNGIKHAEQLKQMTGSIQMYAGYKVPELPWLLCNGSNVSRSDFLKLFDVIGTIYGPGDGNTTFSLPDFRHRFPMGADFVSNRGQIGGREFHELSIDELPSHSHDVGNLQTKPGGVHKHNINDPGHNHDGRTGVLDLPIVGKKWSFFKSTVNGLINAVPVSDSDYVRHSHSIVKANTRITVNSSSSHYHKLSGRTNSTGQGMPFSLLQPCITVNYIIFSE